MSSRKRSGSGSTKRPKEKVVYLYERFLRGEDPTKDNPEFWSAFFLLQPNVESLDAEINKLNNEQLQIVKPNIINLITKSIEILDSDHEKRLRNGLQTLCSLFYAIFKKASSETSTDILEEIFVRADMDRCLKQLMKTCSRLLLGEVSENARFMCLKLLLVLVTGLDDVNQNLLLEYMDTYFDEFVRMLSDPVFRAQHGYDIVILLTILVNYRKHESTNPYVVQLSLLADELALNGYGQMISQSLVDFCRQYMQSLNNVQSSSWFSSLSNIVGNMFVSDEGCERVQQIKANNGLLLALYEAVHLNRNFITTLVHTQAKSSAPPSPSNTLSLAQQAPDLANMANAPIIDMTQYPTNLLAAVFQYCSIVMQDNKNESSIANLKLCFLILTCISEDQYANSLMHDINLSFKVMLHRAQMRHRKLNVDRVSRSQPLAATLLDLLVEFVVTHLMKKFPMELYLLCIGVIHRILCYQKRSRIRLNYPWKELWTALIALLRFLVNQEQSLVKKCNIFYLCLQLINIFNLFITYGDTFLATINSYDELYYELNREEKVFSELHAMVLRYTAITDCEYKSDVIRLVNSLVNILAIIKHFQNKIKEWLTDQGLSTPTEEQILEVVRTNYDLTLKLQDSLDQYERYAEAPQHTAFFKAMVREVVHDTRKHIYNYVRDSTAMLPEIEVDMAKVNASSNPITVTTTATTT